MVGVDRSSVTGGQEGAAIFRRRSHAPNMVAYPPIALLCLLAVLVSRPGRCGVPTHRRCHARQPRTPSEEVPALRVLGTGPPPAERGRTVRPDRLREGSVGVQRPAGVGLVRPIGLPGFGSFFFHDTATTE